MKKAICGILLALVVAMASGAARADGGWYCNLSSPTGISATTYTVQKTDACRTLEFTAAGSTSVSVPDPTTVQAGAPIRLIATGGPLILSGNSVTLTVVSKQSVILQSNGKAWEVHRGGGLLATQGADGLSVTPLNLLQFRNADGTTIPASATTGEFGASVTLGTSFGLVGEAATSGTKTDDAIYELTMPPWYVAASNMIVTVNANITAVPGGAASTKTAQIFAYKTALNGTQGTDIGPGATSAMPAVGAAAADIPFTVTGTTLNPGDKVVLKLETVLTETAGSAITPHINSVRIASP